MRESKSNATLSRQSGCRASTGFVCYIGRDMFCCAPDFDCVSLLCRVAWSLSQLNLTHCCDKSALRCRVVFTISPDGAAIVVCHERRVVVCVR